LKIILLTTAKNGGVYSSLDKFKEFKPNWWEGEINGKKIQIEWQPGEKQVQMKVLMLR